MPQLKINLVRQFLKPKELKAHNLTPQRVVQMIDQTISGFGIKSSFLQILKQELPYLKQHGMTAFDCGYCGKKLN